MQEKKQFVELSEVGRFYPELAPVLEKMGSKTLYPTQEQAIAGGALEKSFLLASGTASGKTLIAQLAAFRKVLAGKKVLYLAPLRSLAFEKFREFRAFPFRTAISVGEMDSDDPWLGEYDIIIATYEKADSLLRHRPDWLEEVGLVVFDEAHEMANKPIIETLAVKLGQRQILFLSATIGNVPEIAEWLGVNFIESNFRPVKLREGVLNGRKIEWESEREELMSDLSGIEALIEDGVKRKKQTLIFNNTRKEAELTADKSRQAVAPEKKQRLDAIAKKIEHSLPAPTAQCRKLASLVRSGTAFHHAGLVNRQRLLVETAFREGLIDVLSSTVTLVAGLNLPSRRVIIKNPHFMGRDWPVSLYKQAAGRSGRPGLDAEGEAILVHKKPAFARENYILGKPEEVRSPLAFEPTLRKEIIGLVAGGFARSGKDITDFMGRTFYAFHYGDTERIQAMTKKITQELAEWGMLDSEFTLTKLGRTAAEVCVDPFTAFTWLKNFQHTSDFGYIHLIAMCEDLILPSIKEGDKEDLSDGIGSKMDEIIYPAPDPWSLEFPRFVRALKLSRIIEDWINEKSEDFIMEKYGVGPGDLRNFVRNMEWLSYSFEKIIGTGNKVPSLPGLSKRIKYGIKSDLLGLAGLPGVGRVKARRMKTAGIGPENFGKIPREKLEGIVGRKTARLLLRE